METFKIKNLVTNLFWHDSKNIFDKIGTSYSNLEMLKSNVKEKNNLKLFDNCMIIKYQLKEIEKFQIK